MTTPNPQAVEAQAARIYQRDPYANRPMWSECPHDRKPYFRRLAAEDLSIVEPHIRSQLLTELAEELLSEKSIQRGWDRWNECKDKGVGIQPFLLKRAIEPMIEAACRQLAAKEESE